MSIVLSFGGIFVVVEGLLGYSLRPNQDASCRVGWEGDDNLSERRRGDSQPPKKKKERERVLKRHQNKKPGVW